MYRWSRFSPAPLIAVAFVMALAGCGGKSAADPTVAPTTAPTAASIIAATNAPATVAAIVLPTATTANVAAAPTNIVATAPTAVPTAVPTARPATAAAANTAAPPVQAANAVQELGITDAGKWFNSTPLTLAGLRGKPVLLVFWSDI